MALMYSLLFLDRIGVVHAQIALAAVVQSGAEIDADRLGVADVQIAVGLRRKARYDRLEAAGLEIFVDEVVDEVRRGGWGGGTHDNRIPSLGLILSHRRRGRQGGKNLRNSEFEWRQVALDDLPNQIEFHAEIAVNQRVPHPADLLPGDIGMTSPQFRGEALDRFTNDFDIADDRVLSLGVREEGFAARGV